MSTATPKQESKSQSLFFSYTKEELQKFKDHDFQPHHMKFLGVTYNPSLERFEKDGLPIIPVEDIELVLKTLYADPQYGYFGRDKWWYFIHSHYLGIRKKDVAKFLKNNETHQIHQIPKKSRIVKPLVVTKPHSYLQIDLIDMSYIKGVNLGFAWIFTCVDLFTKYAWIAPMKTKEPHNCKKILETILADLPRKPSVIQTDSGAEFQGEFDKYIEEQEIKHLTSRAYTPTSQGAIESFNKTLKLMINRFMTDQHSRHIIDVLPLIASNYNNTLHLITQKVPAKLHDPNCPKADISEAIDRIRDAAFWREIESKMPPLERGQFCRILRVRSEKYQEKPGVFHKKTIKQWSDEIYKVMDKRGHQYKLQEVHLTKPEPKKKRRRRAADAKDADEDGKNEAAADEYPEANGLYMGREIPKMQRRDHLQKIPDPRKLVRSKGFRGNYSRRSGINSFNVEEHNRNMGRERSAAAANRQDDAKDDDAEEEEPAPPRRSTRQRNQPVRFVPA